MLARTQRSGSVCGKPAISICARSSSGFGASAWSRSRISAIGESPRPTGAQWSSGSQVSVSGVNGEVLQMRCHRERRRELGSIQRIFENKEWISCVQGDPGEFGVEALNDGHDLAEAVVHVVLEGERHAVLPAGRQDGAEVSDGAIDLLADWADRC